MSVTEFPKLAMFTPEVGAISLGDIDSIDIALANICVGLSHSQSQESFQVIVDNTPQPIIAVPAFDMGIQDESPREFLLVEDLFKKIENWPAVQGTLGLAITGDVSPQLVKVIQQQIKQPIETVVLERSLEATLKAMENKQTDHAIDTWQWISLDAGCAHRRLHHRGLNIATQVSSENPIPADAGIVIRLTKQSNKVAVVKVVNEPNADDPLTQPSQALTQLVADYPDAQNSILIHSMPTTAQGNIELYRLEQWLNEKRQGVEFDLPWEANEPARYSVGAILGDIGVCQVPMMLLLQQAWLQQQPLRPLITIAVEDKTRIFWQS